MKIKAKIKAFYQGSIVKPGQVVEFDGKKLPSWATLADAPGESGKKEDAIDPDVNNAEKLAKLNTLQTEGIALNISIDIEGKTIQQQIDELSKLIEKAKTEQTK